MILSDKSILKMLREGSLRISPVQEEQIQPASVDIRLGNTFSIVEDSGICPDGLPSTSSLQRKISEPERGHRIQSLSGPADCRRGNSEQLIQQYIISDFLPVRLHSQLFEKKLRISIGPDGAAVVSFQVMF